MRNRNRKPKAPIRVSIDGHHMPSLGAWGRAATVKASTISKLLSEGRTPTYPTAQKLAGAIGVSTERLFRWLHESRRTA